MRLFHTICPVLAILLMAQTAAAQCVKPTGKDAMGCIIGDLTVTDLETHLPAALKLVSVDCREQANHKLIAKDAYCTAPFHGLADASGRMLLSPRPNIVSALSRQLAFVAGWNGVDPTIIDLRTGAQRPLLHKTFEWVSLGSADLLFAKDPGANGGDDFTLINPDGSDGVRFTGGSKPIPLGNLMFTTAVDGAGSRRTAWMDATGAVKFMTGEVFRLRWNAQYFSNDWVRTIGEAPIKIDGETRALLLPLGDDGAPLPLPEGLAGVSTFGGKDTIDAEGVYHSTWLLVGTDGSVRFGPSGALKELLPRWRDFPVVDALTGADSTLLYNDNGKPAWSITAHFPGKGWQAVSWIGTSNHDVWPTAQLAMDARVVAYNKSQAAEVARLAKVAAEAEAQRLAAEKSQADALVFVQTRCPTGAGVWELFAAARLARSPDGDQCGVRILQIEGLSTSGISGEDNSGHLLTNKATWCQLGLQTCSLAASMEIKMQATRDAVHAAESAQRNAWRIQPTPSDGRFSVRVYEQNGSYHDERWDASHYEAMTGDRIR